MTDRQDDSVALRDYYAGTLRMLRDRQTVPERAATDAYNAAIAALSRPAIAPQGDCAALTEVLSGVGWRTQIPQATPAAVGEVRIQDGCIVSTSIQRPLADGGYDIVPQATALAAPPAEVKP